MSEPAPEHYNLHEAKTQLSRIVHRVENGEEIVLSRAGTPVAKVVPLPRKVHREGRGMYPDIEIADDFDELPDEIAEAFGMR
ncbi:MAG: type II toxin-antitoxin system Phd/YefM family antitoxin [Streptosporangiales bacterium]